MLIKRTDAVQVIASPTCTLLDYCVPSSNLAVAHSRLEGRYPPTGRALNQVCEKFYCVLSGSAIVHGDNLDVEIAVGDVFYFAPGHAYWVEARGLEVVVGHVPPWSADQHQLLA